MRFIRSISAIVFALALTLGGGMYAPMPAATEAGMADTGKAAAPDQPMPDCPTCVPDGPLGLICAPGCPPPAAILPVAAVVPLGSIAPWQAGSSAHRLAGDAVGPEPPPPKLTLLA